MADPDEGLEPGVEEIMAASVLTVDARSTVKDAAKLMSKKAYGCVLVAKGGRAIGIN